jgi:hypothetical protein
MNFIEFKGHCKGVRLTPRGVNDNHICFEILTEDDGNWFTSDLYSSSHWCEDLITQLNLALEFMKTQEPDIYEGTQYGWKFKTEDNEQSTVNSAD